MRGGGLGPEGAGGCLSEFFFLGGGGLNFYFRTEIPTKINRSSALLFFGYCFVYVQKTHFSKRK